MSSSTQNKGKRPASDSPQIEPKPQRSKTGTLIRDQFQGPQRRSFPGQPPRERNGLAFYMPYSELRSDQQKAVNLLFGDSSKWEDSMPRRSYQNPANFVLVFQDKTWNHLNKEEQEAAKSLDMTEKFWNNTLATFHDDFWSIPHVTLTAKEFQPVLATIRKMSHNSLLSKKSLAEFLLSLEKLLLPSQGAAIARVLEASPSWETLLEIDRDSTDQYNSRFHVHLVVASFLSYPGRFVEIPHQQLNSFWNDDSGGCVWGNARYGEPDRYPGAPGRKEKVYAAALTELIARRQSGHILTTVTGTSLPCLPGSVVKLILFVFLGVTGDSIDPFQVDWVRNCYGDPLTIVLTSSDTVTTSTKELKECQGQD